MKSQLNPQVLEWARRRAGLTQDELAKRMQVEPGDVADWEANGQLTFARLNKLAEKTYTGIGFLFLKTPPVEKLPVSDFRRVAGQSQAPSLELLHTVRAAQEKQRWYREYAQLNGASPIPFVGSKKLTDPIKETAASIRTHLKIGPSLAVSIQTSSWQEAIRYTVEAIENAGILVMRAGNVNDSPNRKLKVEEFRGFALVDPFAPLVFVNSRDAISAQIFTLAHEVAHIWTGQSGVSSLEKTYANDQEVERYCNEVAAEVLVPLQELKQRWSPHQSYESEIKRLVPFFKVSTLVIARRAHDAGFISRSEYDTFYKKESAIFKKGGGNPDTYVIKRRNENGVRFSRAIIQDARAGHTLYGDAMRLLGIKKDKSYRDFARLLNVKS